MDFIISLTALAVPVLLLAAGLTPSAWADRHLPFMRGLASVTTLVAFICALAAAVMLAGAGAVDVRYAAVPGAPVLNFGVYFDSLAATMLLLITCIGIFIVRFSMRYLDGDRHQGQFLRWILFTLGSVLLLVVSRNLLQFTLAWIVTDFGLHQLLTHHAHRPWALWTARKRFLIAGLGDVLLVVALVASYLAFGSLDYTVVFEAAVALQGTSLGKTALVGTIASLFVIAAMTKSAQFPFHSWLPDTMEAPTPVSALMHAGIINAGGFLVIRLSPMVVLSDAALGVLAINGALTALLGGVVMFTQTSVKRSLAFSTIAQMGFMMLQCGLGSFAAALLHIVAHSLYKAHAFLSSGSILTLAARMPPSQPRGFSWKASLGMSLLSTALAVAILSVSLFLFGLRLDEKPGGWVLGFVLAMALSRLMSTAMETGYLRISMLGVGAAAGVAVLYLSLFEVMDMLLKETVSHQPVADSPFDITVSAVAIVSFFLMFILTHFTQGISHFPWMHRFYVHANNGFYLDIPLRRVTARIYGQRAAVS